MTVRFKSSVSFNLTFIFFSHEQVLLASNEEIMQPVINLVQQANVVIIPLHYNNNYTYLAIP